MAKIADLLSQIADKNLRGRIEAEFDALSKNKKFGLVFEEHIPEVVPLYSVPVKPGCNVSHKDGGMQAVYEVLDMGPESARCRNTDTGEVCELAADAIVAVALFGEPVYPALSPIARVQNAHMQPLAHNHRGGQLPRPAAFGLPVRGAGGLHIHRPAVQHGGPGLEVQQRLCGFKRQLQAQQVAQHDEEEAGACEGSAESGQQRAHCCH